MTEHNPAPTLTTDIGPVRYERPAPPREAEIVRTAREFEAVFLTEMLKHAGVGRMTESFNGGPGEAAFTDMLTREYAREISRSGGIGLADKVMEAIRRTET